MTVFIQSAQVEECDNMIGTRAKYSCSEHHDMNELRKIVCRVYARGDKTMRSE